MPTKPVLKKQGIAVAPAVSIKPSRKPVSLNVVAAEMQFFLGLHTESPGDDRVPALAKDLIADFLEAMRALGFSGGDDLPEVKNPTPAG